MSELVHEVGWDDPSLQESEGIRWFNVSADKPERFAVLSKKITTARTHYVKGQGYILCTGDGCPLCAAAKEWNDSRSKEQRRKERAPIGAARTRFALLIAWYNINPDGTLNQSNPVDVGVMAFGSSSKIVQIREIAREWGVDGDPRTVDIRAMITDKSRESFQDFQMQPQKRCLYREVPEVGKALTQKVKNLDFTLSDIIAKERSVEDMQKMVAELVGTEVHVTAGSAVPVEDIDSVLSGPSSSVVVDDPVPQPAPAQKVDPARVSAPTPVPEPVPKPAAPAPVPAASDDMDAFGSILDAL